MKKGNVKVGQVYAAKVSGTVVPVRLDKENSHGGWDGTNMKTKKPVRIKSAQRLRGLWPTKTMPIKAEGKQASATAKMSEAEKKALSQTNKALGGAIAQALSKKRGGKTGATKAEAVSTAMGAVAEAKKKRNSLLNLAAKVLAEAGVPMTCKEMVEKVLATGLWTTKGKTPAATLYAAILREIQTKRDAARFFKVERGKFAAAK